MKRAVVLEIGSALQITRKKHCVTSIKDWLDDHSYQAIYLLTVNLAFLSLRKKNEEKKRGAHIEG